jgi:pilus assembly protein CpaE
MYRLHISAFLTNDETEALFREAMSDIMLVRSTLEVTHGGIAAAVERHSTHDATPDLLVVQSDSDEAELTKELVDLSGVVGAGTQVIVVGKVDNIGFYHTVLDLGVGQYVLSPLTTARLLRAIKDVFGGEKATARGRVIAVVGSKGGIGASTVSHNLAWSLANTYQRPVSLVDLDLHFGTAGIDYNHDTRFGLRDALGQAQLGGTVDEAFLDRLFSKESDYLWLLASSPSMADSSKFMTAETLETVLDGIARMSTFVVLDVPHVWSPAMGNALLIADEVIIVGEPSLQGLRNTQLMFEAIGPGKPQGTFLRYIVNNLGLEKHSEIGVKEFAETVGSTPMTTIAWQPLVFRTAGIQGRMVADNKKNARLAAQFTDLAKAVSGGVEMPKKAPKKSTSGMFGSLFGGKPKKAKAS